MTDDVKQNAVAADDAELGVEGRAAQALEALLAKKRIVICMGSGGVGKTTTSAVLALHAAILGQKALVCTVDPAKRLANSLGVSELDDSAREIPASTFAALDTPAKGRLFAMMLDMKHAFDKVIARSAPDDATRERVFGNRFYRYFTSSLAGTQEYSAIERLYELYEQAEYELVLFDTAPTTYGLDFVDAPRKLFEALDSSVFQWFGNRGKATGLGMGLVKLGAGYVIKVISKFTGENFIDDFGVFVNTMGGLWEDFKRRMARARSILTSQDLAVLIVSAADPVSLEEARYLHDRLRQQQIPVGGFIVNRVHQSFVPQPVLAAAPSELARRLQPSAPSDAAAALEPFAARLLTNAREFHHLADRDAEALARLRKHVGEQLPVLAVPFFSTDVHSFPGLDRMRRELFRKGPALRPEERILGRL